MTDRPRRRVIVRRTSYTDAATGEKIGSSRALDHDSRRETIVVCTFCRDEASVPNSAVPDTVPRDENGRALAVCPRCARERDIS